jgi:hypothetical protein
MFASDVCRDEASICSKFTTVTRFAAKTGRVTPASNKRGAKFRIGRSPTQNNDLILRFFLSSFSG